MTDRERSVLEQCIKELNSADEMMEEWEPELRANASSCVRRNVMIRQILLTQIEILEELINDQDSVK